MMIIGLNKEEIYEIITKVAKNHASKAFEIYSCEDIEQEVWVISLQKICEFEPERSKEKDLKKGLEHWLNQVVSNRLKNFYRDKWLVPNKEHLKCSQTLFNPEIDISFLEKINNNGIILDDLISTELWNLIINNLTDRYYIILDNLLNGEDITAYYKVKLMNKINDILRENNNVKS